MKKSKISEAQILAVIKEHEARKTAADICRGLGIHQPTFYNWKKNTFDGFQKILEQQHKTAI